MDFSHAAFRVLLCVGAVAVLGIVCGIAPSQALALDGNTITSPSGFNHCHWYSAIPYAGTPASGVVCTSTAGPQAGHAVVLDTVGRRWKGFAAHRWIFAAGPRLAYGRSITRWGITCSSSSAGLRCRDAASNHGIYVSTTKQGFFNGSGLDIAGGPTSAGSAVAVWDGSYAVRPPRYTYTGDGTGYITATHWTVWSRSGAIGTGYDHGNDCVPDCADGTFTTYAASFTFTRAVPCHGHFVFSMVRIDAPGEPGNDGARTYDLFLPQGC